jgi:predicted ATPase/DNA-binding winged helix-turn-helix (wHTH) protein
MSEYETQPERIFYFGPFRLSTAKRLLFEGDRFVRLGGKAIAILIALVERAGELVTKNDLIAVAWPDTLVVEANLTVQVAALRRALGEDATANQYIVNSPGRGYRFVAPIRVSEENHPFDNKPIASEKHNLPAQLTRLIGRDQALLAMKHKLANGRLLSIVGPPGVGKTAIALRFAETNLRQFRHGVWLIDLGSISNPSLLPSALASALPGEIHSGDTLSGLASALRYKNLLLVFDNCEHLIDGTAAVINELLRVGPETKILTTSREPLRIEGEQVYRLPPLEVPPSSASPGLNDAMAYPAIQLFVERAAAIASGLELTEANVAYAAKICRELDGNPLAIEIAAARADAFGIKGLATRFENRIHLLAESHRGTLPRHRTLAAALEWSYQLLSAREQYVLRCLGIFAGSFTLDAAIAIIPAENQDDTASILADLVCKSLLSVDVGQEDMRFRLLEITKAFALAKLVEEPERNLLATRLANHLVELFSMCANRPREIRTQRGVLQELDNVRGVLNWAFSPGGQKQYGIALTSAAIPVWLESSLLTECIGWTTKAIDALKPDTENKRDEMILKAAFGLSAMFTEGMTSRSQAALTTAIELAEHLKDQQWELRARLGLTVFLHRRGNQKAALIGTERIEKLVASTSEPAALAMMKSVKSASLFFHADYPAALQLAREAHEYFQTYSGASQANRWGLNHSIYAQCVMARVHWNQGHFDQTIQSCLSTQAEAEENANPTSICQALSWCGCSLFLMLGELDLATVAIDRFKQVAQESNIQSYLSSAIGFEGRLLFLKGDLKAAERLLRDALAKLDDAQYENLYIPFLGRLAELLAADDRPEEARLASAESLNRTKATDALWLLPDALRIHGDVLAALEGSHSQSAGDYLRQSIEVSVQQGSLGSELRSAESLAALFTLQGRREEAVAALTKTLGKFTEGFEIASVRRATAQLHKLHRTLS